MENDVEYYVFNKIRDDLDTIEIEMSVLIEIRDSYLRREQDVLWEQIKTDHLDHSREMAEIGRNIGQATYEIDRLIGRLENYSENHSVMRLAYDYLQGEIDRNQGIIDYTQDTISMFLRGEIGLILDTGEETEDYSVLTRFIQHKEAQNDRLNGYLRHVRDYI